LRAPAAREKNSGAQVEKDSKSAGAMVVPGPEHEELLRHFQQPPPTLIVGLDLFLDLSFEGKQTRCKATVHGWYQDRFFIIGAPSVNGREVDVRPNELITVRYILDGVVYGFNTTFVRKVVSPAELWFLRYPNITEKKQLRRHTRLQTLIPARIDSSEGNVLLVDLSKGGAQLDFPGEADISTEKPVTLSFSLPNGTEISNLPANVRSVKSTNYSKLIGLQFVPADVEDLAPIHQFIEEITTKKNGE
jgi:c-di-GMP-binding flagellar brake protein YcgR